MLALAQSGHGQIFMNFTTDRGYRQSLTGVNFTGGSFGIDVGDGVFVYNGGCPLNGSPTYFPAIPLIGCITGATGLVAFGDLDRDGIRDDFTYWEIISVNPAQIIEPFRSDLVKLYAAPPSRLPRPLGLFGDDSFVVWFNIQTTAIRQNPLTGYTFDVAYRADERNRMDNEIVQGLYQFTFPRLGAPNIPVGLSVTHAPIPEGRIRKNNIWQGFRFLGPDRKAGLPWSADGFVQYDPRLVTEVNWEGNTANVVYPQADNLYFSLVSFDPDTTNPPPGVPNDPTGPTGDPVFPPIVGPQVARVLLPLPTDDSFVMPPFVLPIGAEAVIRVTLDRRLPSSTVTFDRATRDFELPVRFVDTYAGWAIITFPFGSPASVTAPSADPDGDGFTNLEEWTAGTDPLDPTSRPPAPGGLRFVQTAAKKSEAAVTPGYWTMSFPKLAHHEAALRYEVEFSEGNLSSWRTLTANDPQWTVENVSSATELVVKSKSPELSGNGFFRVKRIYKP